MRSRITVVLISPRSPAAFYAREEVRAAISLARSDPDAHRVVPLFLTSASSIEDASNYGLRLKHGLTLSESFTLRHAADKLLELVEDLNRANGTPPRTKASPKPSSLHRRTIDLDECLRCIFLQLQQTRATRIHIRDAVKTIALSQALGEDESAEALQSLIDKQLVRPTSGQRIELTTIGVRFVTTGG